MSYKKEVKYDIRFRTFQQKEEFKRSVAVIKAKYGFPFYAQALEFALAECITKNKIKGFAALSRRKNIQLEHQIAHDQACDTLRDMHEYSAFSDRLIISLSKHDVDLYVIHTWIQKDLKTLCKTARFHKDKFKRLKRLTLDDLYRMRFLITELCRKESCNVKMLLGSNVLGYLRKNEKK